MFKEKYLLIKKTQSLWRMTILLSLHFFSTLTALSFTFFMRRVIDSLGSFQEKTFHYLVAILSFILLTQIIVSFCLKRLEVKTQLHMEKYLKMLFFDCVMNHDDIFLQKYHTQELLQRCHQDIVVVSEGIVCFWPRTLGVIFKVLLILMTLQIWEPRLLLMIIIGAFLVTAVSLFVYRYINKLSHQIMKTLETAQAFLQETFHSLLLIHCFGSSQSLGQVNYQNIEDYNRAYMKKFHYIQICMLSLRGMLSIIYMVGFIWCGQKVLAHQTSLGTLIAMMTLISQLQSPIAQLATIYGKLSSQNASLERLLEFPLFHSHNKSYDYQRIDALYQDFKYLELKDVAFGYDEKALFQHVNMRFDKNTLTAINGVSGQGKTTLLKLLMNIYPCHEGTIKFHGHSQSISLEQIGMGMMGYIPMENQLLYGTIRQIITFYADEIDEQRLKDACNKACVDEFLYDLPNGLDTFLTKQNMPLSQGQLQRISIARALYSQAKILLLDEATSGLDEALEAKVLNNLRDKTVILVSHRPSARKLCDTFYQLKEV